MESYRRLHDEETHDVDPFAIPTYELSSRLFISEEAPKEEADKQLPPLPKLDTDSLCQPLRLPDLDSFDYSPLPPLDSSSSLSFVDTKSPPLEPPPEALAFSKSHRFKSKDSVILISDCSENKLDQDIWQTALAVLDPSSQPKLLTWSNFTKNQVQSSHLPDRGQSYLSEAPSSVVDAAFSQLASRTGVKDSIAMHTEIVVRCLRDAALGCDSDLFRFDPATGKFKILLEATRATGCSFESSRSLIDQFLELGNAVKALETFIMAANSRLGTGASAHQSRIALASAIECMLNAVESYIVLHPVGLPGLLELQSLVEPMRKLVHKINHVRKHVETATSDVQAVDLMFESLVQAEKEGGHLKEPLKVMADRLFSVWLKKLESSIGLGPAAFEEHRESMESGTSNAIHGTKNRQSQSAGEGADLNLPSCIPETDRQNLSEIYQCLDFLRLHDPDHPVLLPDRTVSGQRLHVLEWKSTWAGIEDVRNKAEEYRKSLNEIVQRHDQGEYVGLSQSSAAEESASPASNERPAPVDTHDSHPQSKEDYDAMIMESNDQITRPPNEKATDDLLHTAVMSYLKEPPMTADSQVVKDPSLPLSLRLSIKPYIDVRHAQLTRAMFHGILYGYFLFEHLRVRRLFSMLSSGAFLQRLGTVFFKGKTVSSSRREPEGGQTGSASSLTQVLGADRTTWPPPESNLNSVLTNVIFDTWADETAHPEPVLSPVVSSSSDNSESPSESATTSDTSKSDSCAHSRLMYFQQDWNNSALPHFAMRNDLSLAEICSTMNPESINALEFWRLKYNVQPALRSVFSTEIESKYDCIFNFWLRFYRVKWTLDDVAKEGMTQDRWRKSRGVIRMMKKAAKQHGDSADSEAQEESVLILRFFHLARFVMDTLQSHFRLRGVERPWSRFASYVQELQSTSLEPTDSNHFTALRRLNELHSSTLDIIAANLLIGWDHLFAGDRLKDVFKFIMRLCYRGEKINKRHETDDMSEEAKRADRAENVSWLRENLDEFEGFMFGLMRELESLIEEKAGNRPTDFDDENGEIPTNICGKTVRDGYKELVLSLTDFNNFKWFF